MSKKVLVISTSLRKNSNSDALADAFLKGAKDSGHNTEKISLSNKTINFCTGCLSCLNTGHCIIKDDANQIAEKIKEADILVFATPIYYYEMSGQMKTLLDRCNCLYGSGYKFRDIYLLTAAAEKSSDTSKIAESGLNGWIQCFPKSKLKDSLFAGGATSPNSIGEIILKKAYNMGTKI